MTDTRRRTTRGRLPAVLMVLGWFILAPIAMADDGQGESEAPVFRGELEVSVFNIYVSVIDKEGNAVAGLGPEDFEVIDNGESVPITNFSMLQYGNRVDSELVPDDGGAGEASESTPLRRHVAILFDLPSLQLRNKRRVVEALRGFIRQGLADGDDFLIAANTGELELMTGFTDYETSLMATLDRLADIEQGGDAVKSRKRLLKRSIYSTQLMRVTMDQRVDQGYTQAVAASLQTEVNGIRQQEFGRIDQAIGVADELVRALAGIDGPKTVLWIGEDMAMRPAIDLYEVFYRKAAFWQNILHLTHPEVWGREMDLSRQFQRLAASAQGGGATFHVIDASDRDREMGSADFKSPGADDVQNMEAGGNLWTPGTDMTEFWDVTEGADFLGLATGGSVQKNTRDLEGSMARIRRQMDVTYSLGFERLGAPDGKISPLQVKVKKPDLRVRHHEKVLNKTADQHLVDLALSRVRFDLGANALGMSLVEDRPRMAEDGNVLRSIQCLLPVESLVLMPKDTVFAGELVLAIVVLDAEGATGDPGLMRLSVGIPADRYQPDAVAGRVIRISTAPDVRRVAVGVRDETSGVTSTAVLDLVEVDVDPAAG